VIGSLCFFLAHDGSMLQKLLIVPLAVLAVMALAVGLGAQSAVFSTASRMIRDAALGLHAMNALFEHLLGVTEERPQGTVSMVQGAHELTLDEVEAKLNAAADEVLKTDCDRGRLAGIGFWLARRVQRAAVWGAVCVVLAQCRSAIGPDGKIDLVALRDGLAGSIDGMIADRLRSHVIRLMVVTATVVVAVTALLALLIRQIPI